MGDMILQQTVRQPSCPLRRSDIDLSFSSQVKIDIPRILAITFLRRSQGSGHQSRSRIQVKKLTSWPTESHINEGVSPTNLAGKYIALDCEMVGFGPTPNDDSQLARVSIVNYHGHQIYDSFVLPQVPITDYRTHITGIIAKTLEDARPFKEVQADVTTLLNARVLVGHAIKNDLTVLQMSHPKRDIRDTSRHPAFRELSQGRTPSLKKLANQLLGVEIQQGHHSSVEDARTTMLLFQRHKEAFESEHAKTWGRPKKMGGLDQDGEDSGRKKKKKKGKK